MNKKNSIGFLTALVVVFITAITAISLYGFQVERDINQISFVDYSRSGRVAGVAIEQATLIIDRGTGTSLVYKAEIYESSTVLDVLQQAADEYGMKLKTKTYEGMGVLVEGIGDLMGGQDNKYWLYYVNGEMPLNSVDQQKVIPGDNIEFRFEESVF